MIHQKQLIYQTLLKIKNFFSVKDTAQRIKNQIQNMRKYLQNTFHKIICFRYRKNSKLKAIQFYLFIVCTYFFIHWFIFGCVRASLWHVGSFVAACGLLSKCGSQVPECVGSVVISLRFGCPVACGILVPQPGIKLVSPALEGGFLTTEPPGKSPNFK